jgi:hypothetical protein
MDLAFASVRRVHATHKGWGVRLGSQTKNFRPGLLPIANKKLMKCTSAPAIANAMLPAVTFHRQKMIYVNNKNRPNYNYRQFSLCSNTCF